MFRLRSVFVLFGLSGCSPPEAQRAAVTPGADVVTLPLQTGGSLAGSLEPVVEFQAASIDPFDAPAVVFNEVMPVNESTVMHTGSQSTPDWIEIYNASDTVVALSSVRITDDAGNEWVGGEGTLEPGAHLRVWCDATLAGDDVAPFGLSGSGEELELSVFGVTTDRIATGEVPGDVALARYPDGGAWAPTVTSTPGWANVAHTGTDPSSTIYQDERVVDVFFWLTPENFARIDSPQEPEVEASMQYEGMFFKSVGLRRKGSGSAQNMNGKPALRVDFNAYVEGQKLRGLKGMTFNNGSHDPSWASEYITYYAYREMGIPAPRTGWARVYVNDVYYGLYMNIEQHDDVFLARWYTNSEEGALYEGGWSDFTVGSEHTMDYEEGPEEQDLVSLQEVSAVLAKQASDETYAELRAYVDMDQFALYLALETLVMHWDGYKSPNNWRFYHNPTTSLFEWMPTGTDWTLEMDTGPYYGGGDLITYCLRSPNCRADYTAIAYAACDKWDTLPLEDKLDHTIEMLQPYIEADPRDSHSPTTTNRRREDVRYAVTEWSDSVRDQLD